MKISIRTLIICISLSLLGGCIVKNDTEYSLLSLEEDTVEIYIIFESSVEEFNESIKNDLIEYIAKHRTQEQMPVTMMRGTDELIKTYNVIEFPTILIVDNERVLLQTTDINAAKKFINERAKIKPAN